MRTGIRTFLLTLTLAFLLAFGSMANAVETELAGVRLDSSVVDLLSDPSWGEPNGIGPMATAAAAQETAAGPAGGPGRAGMRGGGGIPAAARRGSGRAGSAAAMRTAAQPGRAAPARQRSELRGSRGLQYWLYQRPGGVKVILGVEPSGVVAFINVQGPPNLFIYTSRGIGLGDAYSDLINAYGYPERTRPVSQGVEITYPEEDVVFVLENLRVTEITIGEPPAPAAPSTPTTGARAGNRGMERPGMPTGFRPGGMAGRSRSPGRR